MADVLTPEQRRRCMAAIRGRNTKPELVVRRLAHALGYRFRLYRKGLPGRPDLVFPRLRTAVFVHGCFWHVHDCRYGQVTPRTNAAFWANKRMSNVARDRRNSLGLETDGWKVVVVWECWTKVPETLAARLTDILRTPNATQFREIVERR